MGGGGEITYFGFGARPVFSQYFFRQAEAMRRDNSCKGGNGVFFMAG